MPPTEIPELPDYSPGALDSFFGKILAQFDQDAAAATTGEAVEQLRIRWIGRKQGLLTRIKAEFGGPMKVVATGGLAPLFTEGTLMIEHIEPDLTLDGLRLLAERNPAPTLPREKTRMIENE